jgi:hypothetical protein
VYITTGWVYLLAKASTWFPRLQQRCDEATVNCRECNCNRIWAEKGTECDRNIGCNIDTPMINKHYHCFRVTEVQHSSRQLLVLTSQRTTVFYDAFSLLLPSSSSSCPCDNILPCRRNDALPRLWRVPVDTVLIINNYIVDSIAYRPDRLNWIARLHDPLDLGSNASNRLNQTWYENRRDWNRLDATRLYDTLTARNETYDDTITRSKSYCQGNRNRMGCIRPR